MRERRLEMIEGIKTVSKKELKDSLFPLPEKDYDDELDCKNRLEMYVLLDEDYFKIHNNNFYYYYENLNYPIKR